MDLTPYLVAHWKMNDNVASTVVLDSSGNGYNGTAQANTNTLDTTGKIAGALTFNGTTDYIDTDQTFESVFQNSFAINFWCKPTDGQPAASQYIMTDVDSETGCGIEIVLINNGLITGDWEIGGSSNQINSVTTFPDGQTEWTMITEVVEKISSSLCAIHLYINGELEASADINENMAGLVISEATLKIGYGIIKFSGSLDDVGLFSLVGIPYTTQEIVDFLWNGGQGTEDLVSGGGEMLSIPHIMQYME